MKKHLFLEITQKHIKPSLYVGGAIIKIILLLLYLTPQVAGAMQISKRMKKAIEESDDAAVIRFLDEGEDINAKTRQKSIRLLATINNDTALVKTLLKKGADPQVLNVRRENNLLNYSDATPLYHAIEHANESVVSALLDAGASYSGRSDFPDSLKSTAMKHAFFKKSREIITLLEARGVRAGVSVVQPVFIEFLTNNDLQGIKFVLAQMPERGQLALVNSSTIAGEALTMHALRMENRVMFDLLISYGADFDNTNSRGEGALTYAIENNDIELARLAIERGAKKEFIYGYAHSPITSLQASVDKNNIDMVRLILSGCRKEGKSFFDNTFKRKKCKHINYDSLRGIGTPLALAADNKNTEIVKLLLEYGADPNMVDNEINGGFFPAINSIHKGDLDTLKVLMDAGTYLHGFDTNGLGVAVIVDILRNKEVAIRASIRENHKDILRYLLDKGVSQSGLNDGLNFSLLMDNMDTDIVKILLDAGADAAWINHKDESQALKRVESIKVDALKMLIDAGLDVNVKSKKGKTLLSEAIFLDRADIIDVLLEHAAVDVRVTPLHIAVVQNNLARVESLLKTFDAEKYNLTAGIDSPVVIATRNNHYAALELFIKSGADVDARSVYSKFERGDTLLTSAIKKKYTEIIDLLLKNNASPDLLGYSDRLPLNMAIKNKDTALVLKLLNSGADVFVTYILDEHNNSTDSPFYKAYDRCDKCLEIILDFKYSKYLNNKVNLNDVDQVVKESREHILDVLDNALNMKNKLLLKMVSARIEIDKNELMEHHKYDAKLIAERFYLDKDDIDFKWQEYVVDTLPFIDKNFDKKNKVHEISDNKSWGTSSLVTLIHSRDKFPQNLIVMAIDVNNEELAIKILNASGEYRTVMDMNYLRKRTSEKDFADFLEVLKQMGQK